MRRAAFAAEALSDATGETHDQGAGTQDHDDEEVGVPKDGEVFGDLDPTPDDGDEGEAVGGHQGGEEDVELIGVGGVVAEPEDPVSTGHTLL